MSLPPLGAHVSVAGGLDRGIERGIELDCTALQVFVKNPSRWREKPLDEESVERFRQAREASPIGPVVAHAAYLINLAASDRQILARSRRALAEELSRCHRLGLDGLVVHPGAHMGAGETRGLARIAASLNRVLEELPEGSPRLLLENTAGQGTVLGHRLSHLAAIRDACRRPRRIGICIDTCHAFAAGYPLHREPGYRAFFRRLRELFDPGELGCLHLNDSRRELGSRVDRHANLGRGEIGVELFGRLLRDRRLRRVPMVVETPLGHDGEGHRRDLELLRGLSSPSGRRGD